MNVTIQEAWRNIWAHKMRSMLSLLSIMIGTASLSCLLSVGDMAKNQVLAEFKTLGTDLMAIQVSGDSATDTHALTLAQWQDLPRQQTDILTLAPYGVVSLPITLCGTALESVSLIATDPALFSLLPIHLTAGRALQPLDKDSHYALIGAALACQWATSAQTLIKQAVQIDNVYFTVLGVLAPWQDHTFFSTDLNHSVIILTPSTQSLAVQLTLNNALLRLKSGADIDHNQRALRQQILHIHPQLRVSLRSAKVLQQSLLHQKQTLNVLLALIGSIVLLVGGIGIMNVMLISVSERQTEIGLRLAIGAEQRHIRRLFLCEAAMLGAIGGIMGGFVAEITVMVIGCLNRWPVVFYGASLGYSLALAITTSLFFGFYPAYRASRLNPIDALRSN